MKKFTLTGALTAVALCLAAPGAVLAADDMQKTQPGVSDQEKSAGTYKNENIQATPQSGEAEEKASAGTEMKSEVEADAKVEREAKVEGEDLGEKVDEAADATEEAAEEVADEAADAKEEIKEEVEADADADADAKLDMSASSEGLAIVGKELHGAGDDSFGEIKNVLFEDGKAHAVVIDIGGFLGIGAKTVAIPMDQISVEGDRVVAMGLTREDAEALPEWKEPREEAPAPATGQGTQPGMQPGLQGGAPAQPAPAKTE